MATSSTGPCQMVQVKNRAYCSTERENMATLKLTKYNAIRALLESGAQVEEIAKMIEVAPSTVLIVKKEKSFNDCINALNANMYLARAAKKAKKEKKEQEQQQQILQREAEKPSVTLLANHYLMEEMRKQTELLKTISAKLAFIVDELTGKESNK